MLKFKGFFGITPNISEIEEALGIPVITSDMGVDKTGQQVLRKLGLQMLLVTQGKFGMTLIEPDAATHIPCFGSDEVTDVTGAGDTVIATFTAAIASGANILEAAIISNIAGGLVVQKQGTATLTIAELTTAIQTWSNSQ
jgi:D-beta-D-heptose 7-phosphate kinase/D-beta-D-heptose 1-phosphate adenosyltransferase